MNLKRQLRYGLLLGCMMAVTARSAQRNEDEWYDPTDWFDGNNYEQDAVSGLDFKLGGYSAGAPYYRDDSVVPDGTQWSDSTWAAPSRNPDLYERNIWDPYVQNYGWYYQWDPRNRRWVREYGWHTGEYQFQQDQNGQASDSRANRNKNSSRKVIRGTIQDAETLSLQNRAGTQEQHRVARITLEDGRTVWVDFARQRENIGLTLDEGDPIEVTGRVGSIDGRQVLFANSARVRGQRYDINRDQQRNGSRTAVVSGRIQEVTPLYLNDEFGRRHKFAEIVLNDGTFRLVDLRGRSIQDLNLSEGERVSLRGTEDQISGRDILHATQITVNGNRTNLAPDRP